MSTNKTQLIHTVPGDIASVDTRVSDTVPAKLDWNMDIAQELSSSIQNFLNQQIDQFANIIESTKGNTKSGGCDNDEVQELIRQLEAQREQFERERAAEIERLEIANNKLIRGWNELENEKRKLLTQPKSRVREFPATPDPLPTAATLQIQAIDNGPSSSPTQDIQQSLACASQIEVVKRQMKLHANRARMR